MWWNHWPQWPQLPLWPQKIKSCLHFNYWMISLPSETSAASMTSVASTASYHQNTLLRMMLPLTWQQNDLSWSLNVEGIIKKLIIYGFLATLAVRGCGGHGRYFQPNPRVICKSKVHISWMYRSCFYELKVYFWWPNKCFVLAQINIPYKT